jgi:putative membrane protein
MTGCMAEATAVVAATVGESDNRIRTHLANERTFLAWLRTGLSLVAVGIGAASFLPLDIIPGIPYVRMLSISLVLAGVATMLLGVSRFTTVSEQIESGRVISPRTQVVGIAVIVAVLGIMAIPLAMLIR